MPSMPKLSPRRVYRALKTPLGTVFHAGPNEVQNAPNKMHSYGEMRLFVGAPFQGAKEQRFIYLESQA